MLKEQACLAGRMQQGEQRPEQGQDQKLCCVAQVMRSPACGLRSYMTSSRCQNLCSGLWTDMRVLAPPIGFPDSIRKSLAWKLHIGCLSINWDQISYQVSDVEAVFRPCQWGSLVLSGKSCGEHCQVRTVLALPKASHCMWL